MSFCDINKDGEIDLEDFNIIRSQFGQTGSNLAADLNNDGIVDLLDYNHWKNNCINHYSEETVFPPLTILGDCNFDGVVDAADYVVWRNQFGSEPERAGLGCDLNGDGSVDAADYTVWRDRYGSSQ